MLENWLKHIEKIHTKWMDLGLEHLQPIFKKVLQKKFSCPVIVVSGTNGKGSTVAFLETVYHQAGYRVASYTSPHLFNFCERIRFNLQPVSEAQLCQAFKEIEIIREQTRLTFFEFTTLAAFWLFQQVELEILILEIGLGGRLDVVNLVDADISVITTVDFDHKEWLGKTRESIGYEKAGVFRPRQMAVCGDPQPPNTILTQANRLHVQLWQQQKDFFYECHKDGTWDWQSENVSYQNLPKLQLPMQNASTALMVLTLMSKYLPIEKSALYSGLEKAFIAGRFQRIEKNGVTYVFDVAHNVQSVNYLYTQLQQQPIRGRLLSLCSMLTDKNIQESIAIMSPIVSEWHFIPLQVVRGGNHAFWYDQVLAANVKHFTIYDSCTEACQKITETAMPGDWVVIWGSFYTVSDVWKVMNL